MTDAADRTAAVLAAFADRTVSVDRLDGVTVDLAGRCLVQPARLEHRAAAATQRRGAHGAEVDALVTEILGVVRA